MGWVWLFVIGASAFGILWLAGVTRALATSCGAALLFGAAGYAWQQHASLPGHPVRADSAAIDVDPGLVAFRVAIMPGEPGDAAVLAAADASLRAGDTAAASRRILDAIKQRPTDAALWAGLGSAVAAHDGGQVSPTAQFAFRRAIALAPEEPGPPFFLGLVYVQTGDMAAAKTAWLRALELAPRDAPYRIGIAERLVMIDQFQAPSQGSSAGRRTP